MRNLFVGMISASLVACGLFGASDEPTKPADEEPTPPPSTPENNATPPPAVTGEAPVGIYVSSSLGKDDGTGSSVRPVKSLRRAFELARDHKLRVIACAEEYAENIDLVDGVSAYGYYDCRKVPWAKGTARAVVKAPNSPAVIGRLIVQPTRIEGFELRAPDFDGAPATDTTGTSVGLEVHTSMGLVISDSLIHGGKGAPGADGVESAGNSRTSTPSATNGVNAYDQRERVCSGPTAEICSKHAIPGPSGGVTTCAIAPSGGPGGQGGDGRDYIGRIPSDVAGEQRGRPLIASSSTALGGLNGNANGDGYGLPGNPGATGAEGTDGSNGVWSLGATGFARGNGTAGGPGGPGQGGGGGGGTGSVWYPGGAASPPTGSTNYATATGGGGGGGGCGGQAGKPATGGGASIGAFVIDGGVVFDHVRIESSAGGKAGLGNLGTTGIVGGTGGSGTFHTVSTTGKGGDGGAGGNGGASGHGAPGPSIALAYSGTKPTLTGSDLAPGPAGAGQPELKRTVGGTLGFKILPAAVGESRPEYQVP